MIRISEHGQKLGILEVVLIHFNVVDNDYQQKSHVLFTFMPNKQCGKVTTISPRSLTMFVKHCQHRNLFIHVWFTDQTIKPLEIEDNADITLIIENNIKIEY